MNRTLLKDEAAKIFLNAATNNEEYKKFPNSFRGIGGCFLSEKEGIYVGFDFTDGREVFVEDFDNMDEAIKFATGVDAVTINGNKV